MHPILIKIGPITIYTYGFFIASAFLLALGWAGYEAKKQDLDPKIVSDLGFYLIIAGILGARLLYVLMNLRYFRSHPLESIMIWKGGLVFAGGAILGFITAIIYLRSKKQEIWKWADVFAPAIALGQFVGRIGCLMAGCCYGRYCTLPWAITFRDPNSLAPLNVPLHPTEIYHSLAGLVTFFVLCILKPRVKATGTIFGIFLVLYGAFRFIIEFFRGDYRPMLGPLSFTQWTAMVLAFIGIGLIILRERTK